MSSTTASSPRLSPRGLWGSEAEQPDQPAARSSSRDLEDQDQDQSDAADATAPFDRMDSAIRGTAEDGMQTPAVPEQLPRRSAGSGAVSCQPSRPEAASDALDHSTAAAPAAAPATPERQPQQAAAPDSTLRSVLAGSLEWLDLPGGQPPTITWPSPTPDGKPRAPIISWASPLASAPSPFASAASVPFDELVAGSQMPPAGAAEGASPFGSAARSVSGTPRPPVWDSPSSDVPLARESPAADERHQSPQQQQSAGVDSTMLSPGSEASPQPTSPSPSADEQQADGAAQSPEAEAGTGAGKVQQQKLAAWGGASGRGVPSLRVNSHNSKSGMASSDSVSSWACPPGALGSLGPTPTASPHYTPTASPAGSLPVSPKLAPLLEHPGTPFDGAAAAAPADCDAPEAAQLRASGGAAAGDAQAARGSPDSSAAATAMEQPPPPPQPRPPDTAPSSGTAAAGSQACQGFDQSHAAPAGACCHDVTPGAAPATPPPNPFASPNPFADAPSSPFPSSSDGSRKQVARRSSLALRLPSSRRDSALDHEQESKVPPPNPFAAGPPPGPFAAGPPPNPFAATSADAATKQPRPAAQAPPNPFAAASPFDLPREASLDSWPRDAGAAAAEAKPANPFDESDSDWRWPAPPPASDDAPAASGTLAEEGHGATVLVSQTGLYNTDRDIMLPHSLIIQALNTGSTELTPVKRSPPRQVEGSSASLLRGSSDASSASESDGGVQARQRPGSGGSSQSGSPPRTSLSTQDLMRGALSPPDDSPVDLSEAMRRSGLMLSPVPVVNTLAAGSSGAALPPSPFSEPADALASLRSDSFGMATAAQSRMPRLPVSPFQGAAARRLIDPRRPAEDPFPLSEAEWEGSLVAAVQQEFEDNGPPSSRSGGSNRSVASLLADNSFAEWLGSERSRSSNRFPDSPSSSLPFDCIAAGPRMSSTDLLKAAAARRPLAREGRHASLDRPKPLGGPDAARHKPPLRTHSAAAAASAALGAASGVVASQPPAADAHGGDGNGRQQAGSIADWRQLLLSTGPERLRLLALPAHRGRGRGCGGVSVGTSPTSTSSRGSSPGRGSSVSGPQALGDDSDGTMSRGSLAGRSITLEGGQRSADSMRSDSQRGAWASRLPLPHPSASIRARSHSLPDHSCAAAAIAAATKEAAAAAPAAAAGTAGDSEDTLLPLRHEKPLRLRSAALAAPAAEAVVAAAEALHATASVAAPLAQKPPASGTVAAVRRSRSLPGIGPSVTFMLPGGRLLAPETRRAATSPATAAATAADGLHSIASEPLAPRPATAPRSFRFASAPARGLDEDAADGAAKPSSGGGSSGTASKDTAPAAAAALANQRTSDADDTGVSDPQFAAAIEGGATALPALDVNMVARAAMIAKALPLEQLPAEAPLSPISVFQSAPSMTSTDCSVTSRRGSASSSTASALRVAVIAAGLNAAIDEQGGWRSGGSGRRAGVPVSRGSSTVLSDVPSLPEAPSDEQALGESTPSWPPSTPGSIAPGDDLAHGPLLSPRDSRGQSVPSSTAGTPESSARSPLHSTLHSPLASMLPTVQEGAGAFAGGADEDGGGEPGSGSGSSPSPAYRRSFSPKGLPPLPQGGKELSVSPPPPAQDPWLLTFYTVPELERGFAAWHSARFAQVDVQHLLYVLAACAIGLANSFSLGAAVLLRWLASSGALAAACVLAHFRPVWYQRHREAVLRVALATCVGLMAMGPRREAAAAATTVPWLQYTLLQSALMGAVSLAATVRTAVFMPSQLLNCALAAVCLAPDATAPLRAWLPLACSVMLMGVLAVAMPVVVLRPREAALRREFFLAQGSADPGGQLRRRDSH